MKMDKEDWKFFFHMMSVMVSGLLALPFLVLLGKGIWFDNSPATLGQTLFCLIMAISLTIYWSICGFRFLKMMWKAGKEDRDRLYKTNQTASEQ